MVAIAETKEKIQASIDADTKELGFIEYNLKVGESVKSQLLQKISSSYKSLNELSNANSTQKSQPK